MIAFKVFKMELKRLYEEEIKNDNKINEENSQNEQDSESESSETEN